MNSILQQIKSVRPDPVLYKVDVEYGLGEVGKHDITDIDHPHAPKMLKDILIRAAGKTGDNEELIRKFRTVSFNQTCFRMSLSVLGCPGGIICRMKTTDEYQILGNISLFASGIIPIIRLTLQAKVDMLLVLSAL
ncbi:hypothetical protein BDA99DRAFT_561403 [Phascolomyces articulosus]|uniref:Uncharacterized protein n=1 Tax=Phascolomyces articulosus TaxID=60185 RepID=A0AAD5K6K0_9FUNG|nr:hypothetical protein BDA99DRAFT_561403 [Phascolomyces articulosus]